MAEAARNFLASLDDEQRAKAALAFDDDLRLDWHYIPKRERKGLAFKEMISEQLHLAHVLLNSGLSAKGYAKASTIMSLESLIREMEESQGRTRMLQLRDPDLYYFSIFGEPSESGTWGWSMEGHHLSLNFTLVNGALVASTPHFHGSEPHEVLRGRRIGLRVLGAEEDLARALLGSLDEDQRSRAVIGDQAPRDVLTAASRKAELEGPAKGLPRSSMNEEQKNLLGALIDEYVGNLRSDLAADRRARVETALSEEIYFAWMGSLERGVGHPHYYRVQASTFLIEYGNIQNNANHSHSVWRDYEGDFGLDLLAEHYRRNH